MRWLESLAAEATSLDAYLREIARFPELPVADEQRLAARVQRRDDEAVTQLVASQLALVLRYAQQYRHLGVPLADLGGWLHKEETVPTTASAPAASASAATSAAPPPPPKK